MPHHSHSDTIDAPVVPTSGALRPLGLDDVRITGGFWGRRQDTNHVGTLPHIASRLESEGWLGNFDLAAAGTLPEGRRGREFADSEVYKYLEALAWEIGRTDDPELEQRFRDTVNRVRAAQEPDGYLDTMFGRPGQAARWSDLEWGHELYCLGHLFQAAVARERTRPGADDGLLAVAVAAADLVVAEFGPDGRDAVCGHPEVEVGLMELHRATGDPRYLEQARLFVERRGKGLLRDIEWGRSYYQDEVPVRQTEVLHGHAVRANYLAAGAVDLAVESGDGDLLAQLGEQWDRTAARRTYITGGQGSHHQDEAFGDDWELPPDRAYSETCAGVGSIMFSWRLLLAEGDAKYADLIERTLYNVIATSPSDDGRAFFYSNTLHQRVPGVEPDPDTTSPRASSSLRAPWFEVSCCPPNVARTLASLAAYAATVTDDGVQVHQYAPMQVRTRVGGAEVGFDVETAYPAEGAVTVRIVGGTDAEAWTLALRVPAWASGATLRVRPVSGPEEQSTVEPGYATVRRAFRDGDVVELDLPVAPRFSRPDARIDAVRGSLAVERGPEVLAVESLDTHGVDLARLAVVESAGVREHDGRVFVTAATLEAADRDLWAYGQAEAGVESATVDVPLIPYHSWANRGPSTMRVWLPRA